ncbi:MAG: DUF1768 domain-containing protein [Clostridia bacterium]|nr:DUF1768 domain-containing protein [Clostridia bacterium]
MNEKSIVVMGGSFNPPTIAHLRIMQKALDAVNAERGFFVPVSSPYLKRKMVKAGQSHLCLPDDLRVSMLKAMAEMDRRIQIDTGEMNEPFAITSRTMERIQQAYPDAGIYFVAGADKIDLLEEFQRKWDFLTKYGVIVFSRNGGQLKEEIGKHALLNAFQSSIVMVDPPAEMESVSSTRIREHLFDVDAVKDMLHPAVVPILRELKPEDYPQEILQFREAYAFLSNDFPAEVTYEGIAYACAASAFLASKCDDPAERKSIARMSLEKAKQKYNAVPGSPAWEERQCTVMEEIVRKKFQQHPELIRMLLNTGNLRLINGGKKDTFWGVNLITWEGENRLGLILMKIRNEWMEGERT